MDDPDMGVALSVTSLVMALAQDQPEPYKGAYIKAAQRLKKIVVDNDIAPDYVYYKVPCPWIQVKYLRLMQYFAPSGMHLSDMSHGKLIQSRGYACSRSDTRVGPANSTGGQPYPKECTTEQRAECRSL